MLTHFMHWESFSFWKHMPLENVFLYAKHSVCTLIFALIFSAITLQCVVNKTSTETANVLAETFNNCVVLTLVIKKINFEILGK